MSSLYEIIGRQQEQIAALHVMIADLIAVLTTLKDGTRPLDAITVTDEGGVLWDAVIPTEPVKLNRHQRRAAQVTEA